MNNKLATYTFLPWLRQGIVSKIQQPDTLGRDPGPTERAAIEVSLQVNGEVDFVANAVQLVGPGDVVGINSRAIVRTEPRNWVTDFEPNYLAFIEFYDEDFPWRYTPAQAVERDQEGNSVANRQQTKLRPWIFLMVLEEGEFEGGQSLAGPLPLIRFTDQASPEQIFPPTDQAWGWAHVHVSKDITDGTTSQTVEMLEQLLRSNPDQALSRLLCPRKLKPLTDYYAFLIPAFEIGRLAGLGQPTAGQDALVPSWGAGQQEYPIYYRWYFRTGERGDFEYLVNLLEPRPVDERVGIRNMDMQDPNFNVSGMSDGPGDVPVMGLAGALKSPQSQSLPEQWPPSDLADYPTFLRELTALLNLPADLLNPADPDGHPDPIISPPLYGRWHAMQQRLEVGQSGWVNELNRDPRYRVPAGFGTEVIQANQETYMQKAWQQVGEVLETNQRIRQVQLSVAASHRILTRHLLPLRVDQQIAVTQSVHSRVLGSSTTLFQQVKASQLPQAALNPAFRRITRPRGALIRKAIPESKGKPTDILAQLNEGRITADPPKTAPDQIIALDKIAEQFIPQWLPDWLRHLLRHPLWRKLLLLLLLLTALLFVVMGLSGIFVALALILFVTLGLAEWLSRSVRGAEQLSEDNLTVEAVEQIPPKPNFEVTTPGQDLPADIARPGTRESLEAANFRTALLDLHARFETELPQPEPKAPLDFGNAGLKLVHALNPVYAIPKRALGFIAIPSTFKYLRSVETIVPVMAHPVFSDPMYKPLQSISSELLIPNLNLIPNNTLTLLETNPKFIEAYMVGLNHEMGRELLWREYPTDLRGSYFRQFWDVSEIINRNPDKNRAVVEEELRDITQLHRWSRQSELGSHSNRDLPTGQSEETRLVLVIKGDLLRKYPTAIIYAQKAKWIDDPDDPLPPRRKIRILDETNPAQNLKEPLFKAEIEPDLRFLGFDLTVADAKGNPTPPTEEDDLGNPGWFFVIQERPGEARFGLDIEDQTPPPPTAWNQLAWNHLGDPATIPLIDLNTRPTTNITEDPDRSIQWGTNAADLAYILYQVPVMVAVHADNMLT